MKEQLYTIPVNDAFDKDCECPVCEMYRTLESSAIEFTMGPSYMEDDVRMETDKIGFCPKHVKLLYKNQNRLGLSLMMLTHMDHALKEMEELASLGRNRSNGLFKKKDSSNGVREYIKQMEESCYICNRIERMQDRYIVTIFYLYRKDSNFKDKLIKSKGFCMKHYALLYERAAQELGGTELEEFTNQLNEAFYTNMKRVRDDLEWFTDKFDYRYVNEPWKNSKDALPRSIQKMNSVLDVE